MSFIDAALAEFDELSELCLADLRHGEELTLNLAAEDQHYLRFNNARVRQSTTVEQRRLTLRFQALGRRVDYTFDLAGSPRADAAQALALLHRARDEATALPVDPFIPPVLNHGCSEQHHAGQTPTLSALLEQVTTEAAGTDFTGLYAGGPQIRATRNSSGLRQVFSTTSHFLDYSLFTRNYSGENKAVKGLVAGRQWEPERFRSKLHANRQRLALLQRDSRALPPGHYRVYLAPAAVADLIGMMSWGALSYGHWKKGDSALRKLVEGEVRLSPLFSLRENFRLGLTPAFNSLGEMSPASLPLIEAGLFKNLLISSRTASEYGVSANGAEADEGLRSPEMGAGSLAESEVLASLENGVYVSNLHYLNWSDASSARVTGMTRYACFLVEHGRIVAPIQDLRFDESLYRILGSELEAVTASAELQMETGTYSQRSLGGSLVPGLLVRDFRFTL